MDWTMVGALGEVGGAVAVVASLLYVGRQVRQNNRIARAEAYREITMGWAQLLHRWADDPPTAKALMESGTGTRLADLPEDVREAFLLRIAATFRVFETIYHQVAEEILDEEALDMLWGQATGSTPLFRDAWARLRSNYRSPFREFVESRYERLRPDAPETPARMPSS
ncbi:MAG: hypothetical protein AB7T31_11110 [Gemmatimonadales bacterium]